jgi:hypothetical protein
LIFVPDGTEVVFTSSVFEISISYNTPASVATMAPALDVYDSATPSNVTVGALGTTVSGKKLKIREYPKFESLVEERLYRKQHLAAAFRVFADRGFDEGVAGHISVRDPILTDHFCKSSLWEMDSEPQIGGHSIKDLNATK